mgnify:CR=1 FL=1
MTDTDMLKGKAALVTGGGSGIGRAIALMLADRGCRVFIVGRRAVALQETGELGPGGQITPIVADIREPEQVDAALDAVLSQVDAIDVLVNNAGGQFVSAAEEISHKGFRAVTRLNLDATWYLSTQVAARTMLPNAFGKIICITMTPRRGMPGMSHSSASRAAVESLVRTWAAEWGPRGVRAVAIAPGIVHTHAIEKYGLDPAAMSRVIPLGRLQRPDEIAALVCFLAGPGGDYMTGTTIVMDGGLDVSGPHPLSS